MPTLPVLGAPHSCLAVAEDTPKAGALADPSLPVTDIEAQIDALAFGYGRTFDVAGRSASAALGAALHPGRCRGNIGEQRASVGTSARVSATPSCGSRVNLIGAPAMTPREFAQREPRIMLRFSVSLNLPTGEYFPDKPANIGTNRWAAKTELGLDVCCRAEWLLEAYAGAWFFAKKRPYLRVASAASRIRSPASRRT